MGVSPPEDTGYKEEGTLYNAKLPCKGHRQCPCSRSCCISPAKETYFSVRWLPQEPRVLASPILSTQSPHSAPLSGKPTHFKYFLQRELNGSIWLYN